MKICVGMSAVVAGTAVEQTARGSCCSGELSLSALWQKQLSSSQLDPAVQMISCVQEYLLFLAGTAVEEAAESCCD